MRNLFLPFLLSSPLLLCGCSGSGGSAPAPAALGQGALRFEVTDAPLDLALIEEAVVMIDRVSLHREADGESGFETIYDGDPREFDLAQLRNGLTRTLTSGNLEVGTYRQARLRIVDAYVRLANGKEFTTADGTLKLTSQSTSGYKIFLSPAVEVEADQEEVVVIDFDLSKVFKPVPSDDLENARFLKFHPNLRASVRSKSAEVRLVVKSDTQGTTMSPVGDAVLHVLPPGEQDTDQSVATTLSEAEGTAAFLGIPPGTYDVLALQGGRSTRLENVILSAGEVIDLELTLE